MTDFDDKELKEFAEWCKTAPREEIVLSEESYLHLLEMLKNPTPSEEMIALMKRTPPWDRPKEEAE